MPRRDMAPYGDPVLRTKAAAIDAFATDELRELIDDMYDTCADEGGVGLAAPQIGVGLRLFVVDCPENPEVPDTPRQKWVAINPEVVATQGTVDSEEGCLSLPGINGVVKRAKRVTMRAFDVDGEPFEVEAGGLLSRCIQHEVDHLNGILFIDRLSALKKQLIKRSLDEIEASATA